MKFISLRRGKAISVATLMTFSFMQPPALAAVETEPETTRYVVEEGDTLWDIASKTLGEAWKWQAIWQQNPEIAQPNLIFPGDVLVIDPSAVRLLRSSKPSIEKRSPRVRMRPIKDAITTIEPTAIRPFLTQSIVVDDESLSEAGYVLRGIDSNIVLGRFSHFYARGLTGTEGQNFQIFRIGRTIVDPVTKFELGIEGVHLGNATLLQPPTGEDGISTLEVNSANQEIRAGDRLTLQPEPEPLPRYFPHSPDFEIETRIIMIPRGVNEAGRRDIVMLGAGTDDGLEPGHVLLIGSDNGQMRDPVTQTLITLPDRKAGTAMVFKLYPKISYAILMETNSPIKIGDVARKPK